MSDKLGDATCTILAALVAILVFCSLALQHIVLKDTHTPKPMQQVFAVVLFLAFLLYLTLAFVSAASSFCHVC